MEKIAEKLKLSTLGVNHLFIVSGILLNMAGGYLLWKAGRGYGLGSMLDTIINAGELNVTCGNGDRYVFYADKLETIKITIDDLKAESE